MIYTLTLREADYLAFQLYDDSTNPRKIKTRNNGYYRVIVVCVLLTLLCARHADKPMLYGVIALTLYFIIFYKKQTKKSHEKHYIAYVNDIYGGIFSSYLKVEVTEDLIKTESKTGESSVKLTEIVRIDEIGSNFFLKASSGYTLVLPKTSEELNSEIREAADRKNIPYTARLDWKW